VPGKQVTLAHLIAHPTDDLSKKIGVPGAEAIGIMTLTPGETAMIAGDIATKAASVEIGFLDRFSGLWLFMVQSVRWTRRSLR
jgi:ethanolamine utilization protein EutS